MDKRLETEDDVSYPQNLIFQRSKGIDAGAFHVEAGRTIGHGSIQLSGIPGNQLPHFQTRTRGRCET